MGRRVPRIVTSLFTEPDDFQAALHEDGLLTMIITDPGQFQARVTQITLHHLHLSAAKECLPRISFIAAPADAVLVLLPSGHGPWPIWGGVVTRAEEILTLAPGQRVHSRTNGPCRWNIIRLPVRDLSRYGEAMSGAQFVVPDGITHWRPPPATQAELRHLHHVATRTAEIRPAVLNDDEAVHGMEQQLIGALVETLAGMKIDESISAQRHRNILSRFEELLDTQPALRITEICARLGVSDRMLRICCQECLGMAPSSYLRLHRMQQVHRALRSGNLDAASVTEVASRYGVGNLGRFAAIYRMHYGELPSATLRRMDCGRRHRD